MVAAKETAMPSRILVGPLLLLVGILSTVQGLSPGTAQQTEEGLKKVDISYTSPTSGVEMYKSYCAACHGTEGKGDGPAVPPKGIPRTRYRLWSINPGAHERDRVPVYHAAKFLAAVHHHEVRCDHTVENPRCGAIRIDRVSSWIVLSPIRS